MRFEKLLAPFVTGKREAPFNGGSSGEGATPAVAGEPTISGVIAEGDRNWNCGPGDDSAKNATSGLVEMGA